MGTKLHFYEICGLHCSEDSYYGLLGHDTIQPHGWVPNILENRAIMFLPNIGPTYHNTWLITQKNVMFAETMEPVRGIYTLA
jgi:hypothetical protein